MKQCLSFLVLLLLIHFNPLVAQEKFTPEMLWQLGRVSAMGISKTGDRVIYSVSTPDVQADKINRKYYSIPLAGGNASEITNPNELLDDSKVSADGKYKLSHERMKVKKVSGDDYYPQWDKSNAMIYDALHYRHWDTWTDGKYNHVMLTDIASGNKKDLLEGKPFHSPQVPFGGAEDYVWHPNANKLVYVMKPKAGNEFVTSTNTDLFEYDIATGVTKNLTESNKGYDTHPEYSKDGTLAWLQMKRDGYEADKQDIIIMQNGKAVNLTGKYDLIHVGSFKWANDGRLIYFIAPVNGTQQLHSITVPGGSITQMTSGDFDVNGIGGQSGYTLVVSRNDFSHAPELYTVNLRNGNLAQLTHVNKDFYAKLKPSKSERRMVRTVDDKQMLVWVIYPPDFDPNKKYPTLLYCQGGPQSALTQFFSFRWNPYLMANQGYIVVAPNRRGMPGHGTKWNEQISTDHGGMAMQDYLSAIDDVAKEKFVDKDRLGVVGASYGGYSAFMLAGMHNNRFKTFIAHDGIFDMRSMFGSTEEIFFVNWDYGGPYWEKDNQAAQNSYNNFNPIDYVDKWNTPMLIFQGEKDYRVPTEQALQAFTALQLRGIKSRLVVFPEENHWVLKPQNAMVWQQEFFRWLEETL